MSAAKRKVKARTKAGKDLVFGLGATGLSVARFLKRRNVSAMYYDSRDEPPGLGDLQALDPDADLVVGTAPNGMIGHARRIIVSPGIADDAPLLLQARKRKLPVVSDVELFVEQANAPIVALTGSNGKSTVASLLAMMCKAAGRSVQAGANLGKPALDLLEGDLPDFYVLELSSFQLHRLSSLPASVAGLLNISPDHLDWDTSEVE
jgi:UDP-N-acetylmuramoylalanine--D-glutamate ligase